MNIFGQGLSTRNNWEPQGGRHTTDASKTAGGSHASAVSSASSAGSEAVPSLQSGQVFRGEILNITSGDVTILLDNQQTINAKLGEAIELNIGQRMYFEVKENQGDQVFIRPLPDMNLDGQAMAAEKALSANGFSFTERNLLIANSLMEAGMPLNKESMRKIMQQQARFPEADIKQLVAMNRLELPVNEMTVKQFAQYSSHEHQLTQAMNHVLDGLEAALGNVAAEGDIEQLQNMNRQIIPSGHPIHWVRQRRIRVRIWREMRIRREHLILIQTEMEIHQLIQGSMEKYRKAGAGILLLL